MKTKFRKTLTAIFTKPTLASIPFADIEAFILSIGGEVVEREGSRVRFTFGKSAVWRCHRPHPEKEAKRYQIEELRELLTKEGIKP